MNQLDQSGSAYLRSAAHQPVAWREWSESAFSEARAQDRPVLLDIGAVWCHWCHVMDGESYEDPGLAEFLNRHFVCVKVDRDERPDDRPQGHARHDRTRQDARSKVFDCVQGGKALSVQGGCRCGMV